MRACLLIVLAAACGHGPPADSTAAEPTTEPTSPSAAPVLEGAGGLGMCMLPLGELTVEPYASQEEFAGACPAEPGRGPVGWCPADCGFEITGFVCSCPGEEPVRLGGPEPSDAATPGAEPSSPEAGDASASDGHGWTDVACRVEVDFQIEGRFSESEDALELARGMKEYPEFLLQVRVPIAESNAESRRSADRFRRGLEDWLESQGVAKARVEVWGIPVTDHDPWLRPGALAKVWRTDGLCARRQAVMPEGSVRL